MAAAPAAPWTSAAGPDPGSRGHDDRSPPSPKSAIEPARPVENLAG